MAHRGRPPLDLAEIGHSGLKQFNGFVHEEFLTNLVGPRGIKKFREMSENDATIGGLLFAIESIVLQAKWQVVAGSDSEKDKKAAEYIKSNMLDMSHSFQDFIVQVLSMLRYGFAPFEKVLKIRSGMDEKDSRFKSRFDDGRFGWRKLALRSQDTVDRWDFDPAGGLNGLWQRSVSTGFRDVFIPINKLILFRTRIHKNNPEGMSVLRNCYRAWSIKKVIEELEGIGIERDLVGLPVLIPPEEFDLDDPDNATVKSWAQDLITHIRRDEQEGVVLPPGWKLELTGSPGQRQFDTNEVIDRWDKRIAMSMLGQFIMLGMDKTGSYALSDNQSDIFMLSLVGWIENIAETINRFAVNPLIELNPDFADLENRPRIEPIRPMPPNLNELGNYVFKIAKAGLLDPNDQELANFMRKLAFLRESSKASEINVVGSNEFDRQLNIQQEVSQNPRSPKPEGKDNA